MSNNDAKIVDSFEKMFDLDGDGVLNAAEMRLHIQFMEAVYKLDASRENREVKEADSYRS
ncbi:MAG: hypothetical protein K6F92_09205 [Lachnospiraceae bacterium]|nr:hypothetical protein [Lachnospiraceae bacterium]